MYFNDDPEPQDKAYQIEQDLIQMSKDKGELVVEIGEEGNPKSFYDTELALNEYYLSNFNLYHNNKGKIYIRIDDDETHILI